MTLNEKKEFSELVLRKLRWNAGKIASVSFDSEVSLFLSQKKVMDKDKPIVFYGTIKFLAERGKLKVTKNSTSRDCVVYELKKR